MKLKHSWISLLLLVPVIHVFAQTASPDPDRVYGSDPLLYNGRIYTFYTQPGTRGDQFLNGSGFASGSVRLRGETFTNIPLAYDVYNQQLVMRFTGSSGGVNSIVISDAWLESFDLDGKHFELLNTGDSVRHIYQVIGKPACQILYSWSKEMNLAGNLGATNYVFSDPLRRAFFFDGVNASRYKNNRTFIALFDDRFQAILKKEIKRMKLNVKKATDASMAVLMDFCNSHVSR